MKNALIIAAVFAAAFGGTMLLLLHEPAGSAGPRVVETPESQPLAPGDHVDDSAIQRQRAANARRTMLADPTAKGGIVEDGGASEDPTSGTIQGKVVTDDGMDPETLTVRIQPTNGRVIVNDRTSFTIRSLPAGFYIVIIEAKGYATRLIPGVEVEVGRLYRMSVTLEKALVLRGIVIDDVMQQGVEGAVVDFNGQTTVKTDRFGTFETASPVTPVALEKITVSHDAFDRATYLRHPFPNSQDVRLALSRGKGKIEGELRFADGGVRPTSFRVRVWRPAGEFEELRRERTFRDTTRFEIDGVFEGPQIVQVDFPGSKLPGRRVPFDLSTEKSKFFEFVFQNGARLEGRLKSRTGIIANLQVVLEDMHGHDLATTMSDATGNFSFDELESGDHRVRVDIRIPAPRSDAISIPVGGVISISLDCESGIATKQ